jgi:hypothetical protein
MGKRDRTESDSDSVKSCLTLLHRYELLKHERSNGLCESASEQYCEIEFLRAFVGVYGCVGFYDRGMFEFDLLHTGCITDWYM